MKTLFYLVFSFFAVVILGVVCFQLLIRLSKVVIWREFKRNHKIYSGTQNFWLHFNASCLCLVVGGFLLSWLCTGRLVFGLIPLPLFPWVSRGLSQFQEYRRKRELEFSALAFFNGLLGLIQSGRGLSSALFDLTQSQQTPFSLQLNQYLQNYQEGKGLSAVISQFRKKTGLPVIGNYLVTLEMAYCQGLPVAPLLELMIPSLEMEQHYQQKMESLRTQAIAQAVLAFMVPWILAFALGWFNPTLFESIKDKNIMWGVGTIALIFEILGVGVLWQITKFY
ncbi:MAG: type II secretion system F family protein [Deltaproteobacteria bacterium]